MVADEQPTKTDQRGDRLVTRTNWIVCSVIALLITVSNSNSYPGAGIAYLLGRFIGSLVIVVFWITVRGIYRWVTKKRPVA